MCNYVFKKTELEDRDIMTQYFGRFPSKSCERTFVNVYLWSRWYPVKWAIVEGAMVFKSEDDTHVSFAFPAGDDESLLKVIPWMKEYAASKNQPLSFYNITPDAFAKLEELFPGRFQVEYDRDEADYIYDANKLATLSGKSLHGQKNHVNKFKKMYADRWSYEALTTENVEECLQMALDWREENGCEENPDKNTEMCVALNALRLFQELDQVGGVLRVDGKIIAFCIGEELCEDTFVVHIEKALSGYPGAYNMINQQFVLHACSQYKYVNREDDAGSPGLREAKLRYKPVWLEDKGYVTEIDSFQGKDDIDD